MEYPPPGSQFQSLKINLTIRLSKSSSFCSSCDGQKFQTIEQSDKLGSMNAMYVSDECSCVFCGRNASVGVHLNKTPASAEA